MNDKSASFRRILKTSSIKGGASIANIFIALLRTKMLALLLGPAGVALVGLYTGFMSAAITVVSMGIGTIGTRQVAEAIGKNDNEALAVIKRAMLWGGLLLAIIGGLTIWFLRDQLAVHILGNIKHSQMVGWVALGVALSVACISQDALLQGMRRIGDMAKLSIYASLLSTALGIGLLWQWGNVALWAFILLWPAFNFLLGHFYISRLPKNTSKRIDIQKLSAQWQIFLKLGTPIMATGLVQTAVQLWIRVSVSNELGVDALGHFQAAWTISMQYIGFVLAAMGADYYPRLTEIIHDKAAVSRLVNEQTEVAMLLSAPIFITMLGLSSWIIELLYSKEFTSAVEVLQWQIIGDVLKVASWPLGFVILATGASTTFFWAETTALLLMSGLIAGFLPSIGLQITGIGFLACYSYYLPLVYFLVYRKTQLHWTMPVILLIFITLLSCAVIFLLTTYTKWGELTAIALLVLSGGYTIMRLIIMSNTSEYTNKVISKFK